MNNTRHILFLSHGGGPMPLLGDPGHQDMVNSLKAITKKIPKPSAILVVSAHWEEPVATLTSAPNPKLIYDYYGFPKESYDIQYPCPGEPALAEDVYQAIHRTGTNVELNNQRGFDHGLFVPLKIMYPDADIPCVQLSLINSLDAKAHIDIGCALQAIDWENLLVIGSGFSFHNLPLFFAPPTPEIRDKNLAFESWLQETITNNAFDQAERQQRLIHWQQAPHARFCHPREEHLLPLHVCCGMAGKASDEYLSVEILGKKSAMVLWTV